MNLRIDLLFFLFLLKNVNAKRKEEEVIRDPKAVDFSFPFFVGVSPDEETIKQKAPPGADVLAQRAGYLLKSYGTTTKDGYNLVIHRLLKPDHLWNRSARPAVLLQHGIAQSSADWLINDSGKSFAMYLIESGYDVWLGNSRGNKYSNSHLQREEETMEFYNFTFHEMGTFDFPATVDLVLRESGQEQISYIGCSVGATVFFVGVSVHPEYSQRIRYMGAISPLTFLAHTKTPIKILAPHLEEIKESAVRLNVMRLNPETLPELINSQVGKLCFWRKISRALCNSIYKMLDEFGLRKIEEEHLEALWKYIPTTTSAKTFIHLLQLMNNQDEIFDKYDFGPEGNAKIYGTNIPPEYDLSSIRLPVAIFTGKEELFSTVDDTEALKKALPYMVRHVEAHPIFRVHTDFTHEAAAVDHIFKPMIFILDFYNNKYNASSFL